MGWHNNMKRVVLTAISTVMLSAGWSGSASGIEAFPGSAWGRASYEQADIAGPGVLGYFNQGVDWITLPGELTLNTFAELRYRFRENNKEFYNAYGPAIGMELRRAPWHVGVDYYWERYPELNETSNRLQIYVSWYHDWDLRRR